MAQSWRSSAIRRTIIWLFATVFLLGVGVFAYKRHPLVIFSVESYFVPPMTDADVALLQRTLVALVKALDRVNATYMMTSGTLLGSYRHHGRIPWDDDADLIISRADKPRVYAALSSYWPEYGLHLLGHGIDDNRHWKFYPTDGHRVPLRPYYWPFIDILFFREDDHYIWNESPSFPNERWPKSAVFPLVRRPFEGLWLPAPCDTAAVLAENFRRATDDCASRSHTHSFDIPLLSAVVIPCDSLILRGFPFVNRSVSSSVSASSVSLSKSNSENGLRDEVESLTIDKRTLHTLTVQSGCKLNKLN
jgi:hypothetical protein